jgi:hypothetical protein
LRIVSSITRVDGILLAALSESKTMQPTSPKNREELEVYIQTQLAKLVRKDTPIGTRVRMDTDWAYTATTTGQVGDDGKVTVKWDRATSYPKNMDADDLRIFDEDEVKKLNTKIQIKIDEATSAFEKAFQAFQEATDLSQGNLMSYEEANLVDMEKLEDVMEEHGWNTSSLYC